jgi:predicted MPP superfamily phosphohydrolase
MYVWWRLISIPPFDGPSGGYVLVAVFVSGFVSYPVARNLFSAGLRRVGIVLEYLSGIWMGFMIFMFVALLAADLVSLGGVLLESHLKSLRIAAVGTAVVVTVGAWIRAALPPKVVSVEVELPRLPAAADGITVLQLSDLHLGNLIGARKLDRVVDRILSCKPDLVAITGDLVDADVKVVAKLIPNLKRLDARLGVFAVLGNHEYYAGVESCRKLLQEAGFVLLEDDHREVAPGLSVVGLADPRGAMQTGQSGGNLEAALQSTPPDNAVVLLQHSPMNEIAAARAGVGLLLNGHTHGGQIWPLHHLVRRFFPHLAGVFRVGAMTQVVSRGAGYWGPPMRLFAPPDIVKITLRSPT